MKSGQVVVTTKPWTRKAAWVGLVMLAFAFIAQLPSLDGGNPPDYLDGVIGAALATVMGLGLLLMVVSTWSIVRRRSTITDLWMSLAVIWLIPYIGVLIILGFSAPEERIS